MTRIAPNTPGTWYLMFCGHSRIPVTNRTLFVPVGQPAQTTVSPQALALQAENEIQLPAPPLQLSPMPSAHQWEYVNVPTWAWIDPSAWRPLQATAAAGPVQVTATATPVQITLSYTDGPAHSTVTCDGPGTPYSDLLARTEDPQHPLQAPSPDCGWTYHHSSASAPSELEPVSATVSYHVTWSVSGAAGGGDLGSLVSPAAVYRTKVGEVQALVGAAS